MENYLNFFTFFPFFSCLDTGYLNDADFQQLFSGNSQICCIHCKINIQPHKRPNYIFFLLIFAENHLLSKHVGLWSLCFCGWKSVLPMTKTEYFWGFPINIMYISNYVSVQDTRYNKIILIKGASYFFISVGLQNRQKIGKIGHKRAQI